jgi:hypothetical protein
MSQSHVTVRFPLKSHADANVLAERLPAMMPRLFQAADTVGRVHYSSFTVLGARTLLFLGDFDGDFDRLMADLAGHAGPVFDAIFQHVDDPPSTPVADNADAFVEWTAAHVVHPLNVYTAYPDLTAKEIKALASAADVIGAGEQRPFVMILPTKSHLSFIEMRLLLRAGSRGIQKDLDALATSHFAQFVPLGHHQIGFFTVYDGAFDMYIAEFARSIGRMFDLLFEFIKEPPTSPCRTHLREFMDFAEAASRAPIGFYQAYPGLTVRDIRTLIADSSSQGSDR